MKFKTLHNLVPILQRFDNSIIAQGHTHITILFFISSTVFNKLCEPLNILLQNRLCVRWFYATVGDVNVSAGVRKVL